MPVIAEIDLWRDLGPAHAHTAGAGRNRLHALRDEAIALAREEALAQPRASWRIVALDREPGDQAALRLEGHRLYAPRLVPQEGRLTALACAVATIGDALETRVRALFAERRMSLALALDTIGNELLFALSRRVQDRIVAQARRQGLTVAGELRAGDPGLALAAQPTVLALAGGDAVGVALTRTLAMNPGKSTAFVQGVGVALPLQRWSRCDDCRSRPRCTFAAATATAA